MRFHLNFSDNFWPFFPVARNKIFGKTKKPKNRPKIYLKVEKYLTCSSYSLRISHQEENLVLEYFFMIKFSYGNKDNGPKKKRVIKQFF